MAAILSRLQRVKQWSNRSRYVDITVGELRSTICKKTQLYVRSGSYIKQTQQEHLSYIKQMPLEHLSYIKETSWNTSGRT